MGTNQVRALLQKLQDGYSKRDEAELDAFMELFCQSDELEVIGTNTVAPGQGEWCRGQETTRALIKNDWEDWGDVVFDVQGAHITVNGNVAWLATTAKVTRTLPVELGYDYFLAFAAKTLEQEDADKSAHLIPYDQPEIIVVAIADLVQIAGA